jgi:hypothetical protein
MNSSGHSYSSVPLSRVQKGAIGQFAFLATALVTGKGLVEVYTPAADNEGRDAEIRKHLKPALPIGVQVKVSFFTTLRKRGAQYLNIRFSLLENRVQNDARLWYFFAYYDERELRFLGPTFLIPSHVVHKICRKGKENGRVYFSFMASLGPGSHDRWSRYRVSPSDLGIRLLEVIDQAPLTTSRRALKLPAAGVSLMRARPSIGISRGRQAA